MGLCIFVEGSKKHIKPTSYMGYCPMKKDKIYNYNAAAMEIDKAPEGVLQ